MGHSCAIVQHTHMHITKRYTYACPHTHAHTHVHTYIHIHPHTFIYIFVSRYAYIYICIHIDMPIHVYRHKHRNTREHFNSSFTTGLLKCWAERSLEGLCSLDGQSADPRRRIPSVAQGHTSCVRAPAPSNSHVAWLQRRPNIVLVMACGEGV